MPFDLSMLSQLGTPVAMLALMLWYMHKRDTQTRDLAESGQKTVRDLASAFRELTTGINVQNELLRNVLHDHRALLTEFRRGDK